MRSTPLKQFPIKQSFKNLKGKTKEMGRVTICAKFCVFVTVCVTVTSSRVRFSIASRELIFKKEV